MRCSGSLNAISSNNRRARYSSRFLNIANPWTDKRLLNWQGYVETRYFDSENHPVDSETPGAQAVEMIPLGLYGLDNPKIPMLLVDFRDSYNPKKREMSRRVLNDVTRNMFSLSKFGNLPFFLGRTVFDFVTGRRGMDVNQPSRLQTYSQLKLLLPLNRRWSRNFVRKSVDDSKRSRSIHLKTIWKLKPKLRPPNTRRCWLTRKIRMGWRHRLERDRRAEMLPLEHGDKAQFAFRLMNVLSFGKYVHREELTDDMEDRIDIARRLQHHTRFLQDIAKSSADIDITWNLEEVRRSLRFIAEHGSEAGSNSAAAAAKIFARSKDDETRRACLDSLSRIHSPKAKNELLRISQNTDVDKALRDLAGEYLRGTNPRVQPIAATVSGTPVVVGQP